MQAWVQVTQIGLDAFADHSEMVVWATGLQDGAPLAGVTIEADAGQAGGGHRRGRHGQVRAAQPGHAPAGRPPGRRHGHPAQITLPWGDDAWQPRPVQDELRWYVFDDRAMYRPGEEVHVKGWLRQVGGRQDGDVGLPGDALQAVRYQVIGPRATNCSAARPRSTPWAALTLVFTLPENANLGYARFQLEAAGQPGRAATAGITTTASRSRSSAGPSLR